MKVNLKSGAKKLYSLVPALWVTIQLAGCAKQQQDALFINPYENPQTYFTTTKEVDLTVAYEPGAEPYVGVGQNGIPLWSILAQNIQAVFGAASKTVTVNYPQTLDAMTSIPAQGKAAWTSQDILNLATTIRTTASTPFVSSFVLVFVNGYYSDEDGPDASVLGVNIQDEGVIAVFKNVIAPAGQDPSEVWVSQYLEQSTLVHEMGHALGLVDNGVPPSGDHVDNSHGSHCTNPNCVMNYKNHTAANPSQFEKMLNGAQQSLVLFGQECLNDIKNFMPSGS